jgi:hypothetical protein
MRPAYLIITKVTCIATEDTFGDDDLYGIMGSVRFSLGSYSADVVRTDFVELVIPLGVTELTIAESDFPDSDDMLGTIDLTADMDRDRTFGILTDSARYTIDFMVVSEADDVVDESSSCTATCPTCGNKCIRRHTPGQFHWCGRHEWGFN